MRRVFEVKLRVESNDDVEDGVNYHATTELQEQIEAIFTEFLDRVNDNSVVVTVTEVKEAE